MLAEPRQASPQEAVSVSLRPRPAPEQIIRPYQQVSVVTRSEMQPADTPTSDPAQKSDFAPKRNNSQVWDSGKSVRASDRQRAGQAGPGPLQRQVSGETKNLIVGTSMIGF